MKKLKDFSLQGKRILLRCDLNVPMDQGKIQDDFRIVSSIPTITYITEQKGKCIILAHFGRPDPISQSGDSLVSGFQFPKENSLEPIAQRLEQLLGKNVRFFRIPVGQELTQEIEQLKPGDVALLENIRFYKGEEENNMEFAKQVAGLGDIYVNDAFGVNHRAHASVAGIPKYLPATAGLLLQKEVEALGKVSKHPEKPLVVLVGGAKVENKASFLREISRHASSVLLGNLLSQEVQEKGLPVDRQGGMVSRNTEVVYALDGVDGSFDLGPETIQVFSEKIRGAKTVFWAGPLGMIEEEKYEKGSLAIADAIIKSGAYAVAGGGDLAGFLGKHNLREKFNHVSTGGGAMLAFLAGETLPGLQALER